MLASSHIVHVVFVLSALLVHGLVEKGSIECQGDEGMSIQRLPTIAFPSISADSLMGVGWRIKTGGRAQDLVHPRSSHIIKAPGKEIWLFGVMEIAGLSNQ